jgi:hypothetical protein
LIYFGTLASGIQYLLTIFWQSRDGCRTAITLVRLGLSGGAAERGRHRIALGVRP